MQSAGTLAGWPVRAGKRLVIAGLELENLSSGAGPQRGSVPRGRHTQASLSKSAHFRGRDLSVRGPSPQDIGKQGDQTRKEGPPLGGIGSRVQPLKEEGWPGLDGEPGPS